MLGISGMETTPTKKEKGEREIVITTGAVAITFEVELLMPCGACGCLSMSDSAPFGCMAFILFFFCWFFKIASGHFSKY